MSNDFYNHGGYPAQRAAGSSAAMRSELDLIMAGFDKMPALSGNGGKPVVVNAAATGLETTSALSMTSLTLSGALTVGGTATLNGNTVIGNAAGDTLTIAPSAVTWSNNPTHSGIHTFSSNVRVGGSTHGQLGVRQNGVYGGAGPNSNYDDIVVENTANAGISILTPNTAIGGIRFGDPESSLSGAILYNHSTDLFEFATSGTTRVSISSVGAITFTGASMTWAGNPTHSGAHTWSGAQTWSAGGTFAADLTYSDSDFRINADTADAADNKRVVISGGGGFSDLRGANLLLAGNEHAGQPGQANLYAGATGSILLQASTTEITASTMTWSGNPTHSGDNTWSGTSRFGTASTNIQLTSGSGIIRNHTTGSVLDMQVVPADGTGDATVRMHRATNTTGVVSVQFLRGNNSTTSDFTFTSGSTSTAELCRNSTAGTVRINGSQYGTLGIRQGGNYGGAGPNSSLDDLVIENSGNAGISILTPNSVSAYLLFGDPDSNVSGGIDYNHSIDELHIRTNGTTRFTANGSNLVAFNQSPASIYTIGYLGAPITDSNSTFTFALTDAGSARRKTNATAYTWTIPNDATVAFPIGTVLEVINDGTAGNVTIARGASVVLVESSGTDANRTLPPNSIATIQKMAANRWRITGEYI